MEFLEMVVFLFPFSDLDSERCNLANGWEGRELAQYREIEITLRAYYVEIAELEKACTCTYTA